LKNEEVLEVRRSNSNITLSEQIGLSFLFFVPFVVNLVFVFVFHGSNEAQISR
jgi:hypothetical protein